MTGPVTTEVTNSAVDSSSPLASMAGSTIPLPKPEMISAPPVPHAKAAIQARALGRRRAIHARKIRPTIALRLEAPTASHTSVAEVTPSNARLNSYTAHGTLTAMRTRELMVAARDLGRLRGA